MPELPELHHYARNLKRCLAGHKIIASMTGPGRRRNFSTPQLSACLNGRELESVFRSGKQIHFRFEEGIFLAIHLMLAGRFELTDQPETIAYARLGLQFDHGPWLIVSDKRGLARFTLHPKPPRAPDALDASCSSDYLRKKLRQYPATPIKAFLVDQQVLGGIGNAYADEILWHARISPHSICDRIPEGSVSVLHSAIRKVLLWAIEEYAARMPDAIHGEQRDFLNIHHPERERCPDGHPVHCILIGSRKSYYCEEQELFA